MKEIMTIIWTKYIGLNLFLTHLKLKILDVFI